MDTHQYRGRQAQQRAAQPSVLPSIAVAAVAFVLSGLTVLYWDRISQPRQWLALLAASSAASGAPSFSGDRIGRAETAPLLKACLTNELLDIDPSHDIEPALILDILTASGRAGRLTAAFGTPRRNAAAGLAAKCGTVADCVYRQNSWTLCDIDNRALAIAAANTFMRQADEIIATPARFDVTQNDVHALAQVKDRVLDSLKDRVKKGVLIVADFAPFAPTAVRHALNETRTAENACAKH